MQAAYTASPLVEPYNEDGSLASYSQNGLGYSTMIYSNPLNHFLNGGFNSINKSRDFGVGATFYWIVEPIKNLRYRGQFNTGYSGSNSRSISKPYSSSSTSASTNYGLNHSQNESSSFTLENTISYILPKLGKNTIDVLVGQSIEKSNWSTGMSMNFSGTPGSLVFNGWDYNIPSNFRKGHPAGSQGGCDNPKSEASLHSSDVPTGTTTRSTWQQPSSVPTVPTTSPADTAGATSPHSPQVGSSPTKASCRALARGWTS